MRVAYRIAMAALLVAALAACAGGPGAAKPALIGTWQVTSYTEGDVDATEEQEITLVITATTYTERYDPPLETDEDLGMDVGIEAISAKYEADAEKKILTMSDFKVELVGEDSDLIERIANLVLSEYPETQEVTYSFPEPDRLRLESADVTLIARRSP